MATLPASRSKTIALWVLRVVLALIFLATGFFKLSGQPMMITEFDTIGLGQWFRYLTGALEVIGGLVVLVPSVSAFGAVLLFCVSIGAFVAQVGILHQDFIHTLVLAALAAVTAYLQRDRLPLPRAA